MVADTTTWAFGESAMFLMMSQLTGGTTQVCLLDPGFGAGVSGVRGNMQKLRLGKFSLEDPERGHLSEKASGLDLP